MSLFQSLGDLLNSLELSKNSSFTDQKPTFAFRQSVDGHEKIAIREPWYCKPLRLEMISWNHSSTGCSIRGFSFYNIWYENKILN